MAGFITRLILRSKLKESARNINKAFLPWEKINHVALIISASSNINKSAVDEFIAQTKKFVEVFYIETKSKQASFADWHCFSKKDRSFFNLPNKQAETQLKNKKFDLVINTGAEDDLFSSAVLGFLSAPLKCSSGSWMQDANLVVKKTGQISLLAYLNDTLKYLQMIKVA